MNKRLNGRQKELLKKVRYDIKWSFIINTSEIEIPVSKYWQYKDKQFKNSLK